MIEDMPTIEFTLQLDSPLHIGNGETPGVFARDARGRPCIPATTLKGLHRASVRAVSVGLGLRACESSTPEQMCHPLPPEQACPVCLIFGSPWLPGRLFYRDVLCSAQTVEDTRVVMPQSRKRQVAVGRFTTLRETLPANTSFSGRIDLHLDQRNDPALLALALLGLRAITRFGAGSAHGYGLCHVEARALDDARLPILDSDLADALKAYRART